ncbi:MAG: methionyl-tRNA formyltransferase [Planctomycetes bacterium]|nr:methionyl-tRNA formyltransferase [Planctomycetota bacterium]
MRILFAGTSAFGVPTLEALIQDGWEVVGVISQPDRPTGRGRKLQPTEMKVAAERHGLLVAQPEDVNAPEVLEEIRGLAPDLLLTAAYGQKLGKKLLALPPKGCFNLHASLLPKYRGASPIAQAILDGERESGVTIFRMESRMDAGPILNQGSILIGPEETAGELETRLSGLAAGVLLQCIRLLDGIPPRLTPQDDEQATLAPRLQKTDGLLDWTTEPGGVVNRVRGLQPWPGAYAFLRRTGETAQLRVGILRARAGEARGGGEPGAVLAVTDQGLQVGAGRAGSVWVVSVKPESRSEMSATEFSKGYRVTPGDRFERPASC